MRNISKLLSLTVCLSMLAGNVGIAQVMSPNIQDPINFQGENLSNFMQADIKSERIPAGTVFKLRMETPVNSYNTTLGDTFRATLVEDIRIGTKVVIPSGTIIRGRAGDVKKNSYLSRGGKLNLTFDHLVTPMGKQVPLSVKINNAKYLDVNGNLSAGGGYLNTVSKNIDQGCEFLSSSAEWGVEAGKSFFRGYPVLVTVPLGTAVGLAGAGGIFVVKSTVAIFKKGDNVRINPGDVIEVILKDPLDIPLN